MIVEVWLWVSVGQEGCGMSKTDGRSRSEEQRDGGMMATIRSTTHARTFLQSYCEHKACKGVQSVYVAGPVHARLLGVLASSS